MDRRLYGLYWNFDKGLLHHVCRVSVWSMFHSFIGVASWLAFFVAVEHLGEMELAATNVIRSVSTVFFVIVNSLAATTGSLVSNLLGAGQKRQVIPLCNCVVRLGYAIGFPLVILAVIFYRPIIGIYTESTALMQIAHLPFVVMLLNYILCLARLCLYEQRNRYGGGPRMTFIFQLITIVAYQIYLWSISSFSTSLSVYWTAEISVCDITRLAFCHLSEI